MSSTTTSMLSHYKNYKAQFTGPSSFPDSNSSSSIKNNGIVNNNMGMPRKFNPSAHDNLFSQGRQGFIQNVYKNYNRR